MFKLKLDDTIAAISTPLGQAGIGIVRLSGKDALSIADKIFVSKDKAKPSKFQTYTTHYGWVVDGKAKDTIIDEVILTVMRSPKSYTREDIVEINCHSGIIPLRKILDLVLSKGARLAEPGEFTRRAFINGRIDLVQAEAVLDIVRAKTDRALQIGVNQLSGELSKRIVQLREELLDLLVPLEAEIDFPEEDVRGISLKTISERVHKIKDKVDSLLANADFGQILREGINIVICGSPNVGKSSLLNTLIRQEKAIVTPIPGTTRDIVEEIINLEGIPLRFVDTAGIIEPRDLIEKEAIKRSHQYIDSADLVLLIFDGAKKLSKDDRIFVDELKNKNVILVINKIDLPQKIELNKLKSVFKNKRIIKISALYNKGIDQLEKAILKKVWQGELETNQEILVSNLRHIEILKGALENIKRAVDIAKQRLSVEFIADELKQAIENLDRLTGKDFSEDLLEKIFAEFCIGK